MSIVPMILLPVELQGVVALLHVFVCSRTPLARLLLLLALPLRPLPL